MQILAQKKLMDESNVERRLCTGDASSGLLHPVKDYHNLRSCLDDTDDGKRGVAASGKGRPHHNMTHSCLKASTGFPPAACQAG
jgi:hypothetical protein